MSSIATKMLKMAPLAKGPLGKPDGMRGALLQRLKTLAIPLTVTSFGFYGLALYVCYFRRLHQIEAHMMALDPDALFEEIKEYGGFRSVKASWQEDDD